MSTALLILAAGESSRLGQAKQLRVLNGKTLLERIIHVGQQSDCSTISVVLGSHHEQITALEQIASLIDSKELLVVRNDNWSTGMGSSISAGIIDLSKTNPNAEAAIICPCDQPYINSSLLNDLIAANSKSKNSIIACSYDGIIGTPALFPSRCFSILSQLQGPEGGRKLLRDPKETVLSIPFPEGAIDIDTEENWQDFLRSSGESPIP